jgi:CheY-like chemotaxis protein
MATQSKKSSIEILLADDDMDDRFFFEKALSQMPLRAKLTTVSNGEQLMDYLKANSSHPPDVLFLDLNMPRKTDLNVLRK